MVSEVCVALSCGVGMDFVCIALSCGVGMDFVCVVLSCGAGMSFGCDLEGRTLRNNDRGLRNDRIRKYDYNHQRNDHNQMNNNRGVDDRHQKNHNSPRNADVWSDLEGRNENNGLLNALDNKAGLNHIVDHEPVSKYRDDRRVSYWKKPDSVQDQGLYD